MAKLYGSKEMKQPNYWTEDQKLMITKDGKVRKYIDSNEIEDFEIGDCADLSFPRGYNKYYRVFKKICPCITVMTARQLCVKVRKSDR